MEEDSSDDLDNSVSKRDSLSIFVPNINLKCIPEMHPNVAVKTNGLLNTSEQHFDYATSWLEYINEVNGFTNYGPYYNEPSPECIDVEINSSNEEEVTSEENTQTTVTGNAKSVNQVNKKFHVHDKKEKRRSLLSKRKMTERKKRILRKEKQTSREFIFLPINDRLGSHYLRPK